MCPPIWRPPEIDRSCDRSAHGLASTPTIPVLPIFVYRFRVRAAMALRQFGTDCPHEFHLCQPTESFALDRIPNSRKMCPVRSTKIKSNWIRHFYFSRSIHEMLTKNSEKLKTKFITENNCLEEVFFFDRRVSLDSIFSYYSRLCSNS